jgi:integrase
MPQPDSIIKHGDDVIRFRTSKFNVAVYRQRFTDKGETKYSRPFYFGKTINGKLTRFPLGVDMRKAEKRAEEIAAFLSIPSNTVEMALELYNPRGVERANKAATFTDVLKAYHEALGIIGRKGKPVSESTYGVYRSFLATLLRKTEAFRAGVPFESQAKTGVRMDYSEWFDQPLTILTAKFAMDFKLSNLPPVPEGEEEADEEEILTAKITADSTLRCARAFFSKSAMRYYKLSGLKIPDISGFMSEPDFGAVKYFQLLPPDVIVALARASIELREADLDAYRGYLLCMHCGLRRGEALAFQPAWLREEDDPMIYVTVSGAWNPKHGHGRKAVIAQWVFEALEELGPIKEAAALDRLNGWVKGVIPKEHAVTKPLHELRKCWVSCKAKTDGIHSASKQAGHKDVKVTTTHYADSMMPDWLLPLWKNTTEEALSSGRLAV